MVNPASKKKVKAQVTGAKKGLEELLKGASHRTQEFYGPNYRMNTKKADKHLKKKSKK